MSEGQRQEPMENPVHPGRSWWDGPPQLGGVAQVLLVVPTRSRGTAVCAGGGARVGDHSAQVTEAMDVSGCQVWSTALRTPRHAVPSQHSGSPPHLSDMVMHRVKGVWPSRRHDCDSVTALC